MLARVPPAERLEGAAKPLHPQGGRLTVRGEKSGIRPPARQHALGPLTIVLGGARCRLDGGQVRTDFDVGHAGDHCELRDRGRRDLPAANLPRRLVYRVSSVVAHLTG